MWYMAERCMADDASSGLDLMMNDRFAPVRYTQYRTSTRSSLPSATEIKYGTVQYSYSYQYQQQATRDTKLYATIPYVMLCVSVCLPTTLAGAPFQAMKANYCT